ncbi:MAG: DUF1830 domain-containing protein [Cyanobacteria bacterium P01_G01_bin.67]
MSSTLRSQASEPHLCRYVNRTGKIQIAEIEDVSGWNSEVVLFPHETFLFEAPVTADLAIYIEIDGKTTLLEKISCSSLQTESLSASQMLEIVH